MHGQIWGLIHVTHGARYIAGHWTLALLIVPQAVNRHVQKLRCFFLRKTSRFPRIFVNILAFNRHFFTPSFLVYLRCRLAPVRHPADVQALFDCALDVLGRHQHTIDDLADMRARKARFLCQFRNGHIVMVDHGLLDSHAPIRHRSLFHAFSPSFTLIVTR